MHRKRNPLVCRLQVLLRLVPHLLACLSCADGRCLELPLARIRWLYLLLRLVHKPCSNYLCWRVQIQRHRQTCCREFGRIKVWWEKCYNLFRRWNQLRLYQRRPHLHGRWKDDFRTLDHHDGDVLLQLLLRRRFNLLEQGSTNPPTQHEVSHNNQSNKNTTFSLSWQIKWF